MDWRVFAREMASMARDLLAQDSVGTTLEHITKAATQRVAGCDAAGILLLHGKRVETLAPTHDLVVESDRLQERLGEVRASMPPARNRASGCSASRISAGNSRAGPPFAPHARRLGVMPPSPSPAPAPMLRWNTPSPPPVIGGAMGSPDLTEEQAFEVLRRYSQEHNVTLREVARLVCEQGSLS